MTLPTGVLVARLSNQRLSGAPLPDPADVVAWLGAVQAQDYGGAKWALARRSSASMTDAVVEDAFDAGRILRTHVLRPTWHFVAPADIRWMVALTGPRVQAMNRRYARTLGLDDRMFTRGRAAIERALEGGTHLTRDELAAVLRRARITVRGQPLAHLLMDIEAGGGICSGPRRGKQFTYALVEERAPRARVLAREEAVAELARRYFRSHGPATASDFAWWSGLAMKEARAAAAMSGGEVLAEPPGPERVRGATFLLPNYDEYLIAYRDRSALIDAARARNLGVFTTVEYPNYLIVDGRVAGSWRRTMSTARVTIEVKVYEALRGSQRKAVSEEARRHARFLGVQCEVRL